MNFAWPFGVSHVCVGVGVVVESLSFLKKSLQGSVVKLELYLPTTVKGLTYSKCLMYSFVGPAYI